jgi:hypothetical protein
MRHPSDLTGLRFGRLVVLRKIQEACRKKDQKRTEEKWLCLCDCEKKTEVFRSALLRNKPVPTRSCGCLSVEMTSNRSVTHGDSKSRLYGIWENMKSRCYNKRNDNYLYYGGREITVCESWKSSFSAFRDWALSNGYNDSLTIDRIDSDGNYTPENCRFITMERQNNNRRSNEFIEVDGLRLTFAEWGKRLGAKQPSQVIYQRLKNGWTEKEAVTIPLGGKRGE